MEVPNTFSQLKILPFLAMTDTGAINGMSGLFMFLAYDEKVLEPLGMGFQLVKPPERCGGVGGQAQILSALVTPAAIGGVPGLLSIVVILQSVPWLLPIGLMLAMKGEIILHESKIRWAAFEKAESKIQYQQSGHPCIDITEGLEKFFDEVPNAKQYNRESWHDDYIKELKKKASDFNGFNFQSFLSAITENGHEDKKLKAIANN